MTAKTSGIPSLQQAEMKQKWLNWQATRNAMLDLPDISAKAAAQHHRHGSEASSTAWAGLPDMRTVSNGTTSSCTALSVQGDVQHQHDCAIKSASPPHVHSGPMFNAFGGGESGVVGGGGSRSIAATPRAAEKPCEMSSEEHVAELVTELRALTLELRHSNMVQTQLLETLLAMSQRAYGVQQP